MAGVEIVTVTINRLMELANSFSYSDKISSLELLRGRLESNSINIAVMGEFSAGKSYFINALLGMPGLLPVGVTPTTAVITRCFEAPESQPAVYFSDTNCCAITTAEVKQVLMEGEYQKQPVDLLNLPLTGSRLPQKLNLIDTPGIGSLNPRHRQIVIEFLPRVDLTLYLFNQSLRGEDIEFIRYLEQLNPQIVFIMTQTDLVNDLEINVEELANRNRRMIAGHTSLTAPILFCVSSKLELAANEKISRESGFTALRDYLTSQVTQNLENLFIRSQANKLAQLMTTWLSEIELMRTMTQTALSGTDQEFINRSAKTTKELEQAKLSTDFLRKRLDYKLKEARQDLEVKLRLEKDEQFETVRKQLEAIPVGAGSDLAKLQLKLERNMEVRVEYWRLQTELKSNGFIQYGGEIMKAELAGLTQTLSREFGVQWKVEAPADSVQELVALEDSQEVVDLCDKLTYFTEHREELLAMLDKNEVELTAINLELEQLGSEIQAGWEEMTGNPYQPVYIRQTPEPQKSWVNNFTKIGNLVDWAFSLLPVPGAKAAQVIELGDKFSKFKKTQTVLNKINQNRTLVKTVRFTQKAAQYQRNIQTAIDTLPESAPTRGMLSKAQEFLSVEGILKRVGQKMDQTNQRYYWIEDPDHKQAYEEFQSNLRERQQERIFQLDERERVWGEMKNKQQELQDELNEFEQRIQQMQVDIQSREAAERKQVIEKQFQEQRQRLLKLIETQLTQFYHTLHEKQVFYLEQAAAFVSQSLSKQATGQIEALRQHISQLKEEYSISQDRVKGQYENVQTVYNCLIEEKAKLLSLLA